MLIETIPEKDIDNTVTQVNQSTLGEENLSSIFVKSEFQSNPTDLSLSNWNKDNFFYSTSLILEPLELKNNSTWQEKDENDFEIVPKLNFNKTFKVKSRIKAITRYSPKIIID